MAKMPGQAARLIGVLHVLNGVSSQPAEVEEEISLTTVRAGCHLAQFYLGQVTILQGDGDALHGELTPILKSLLEKVNDKGELNATQAKSAVWGLRTSKPEEIRQYFNELAAMDLAEVQGSGSRLTLKSNLRNVEENLRNVEENLRNVEESLRNVEENLRDPKRPQAHIYQDTQKINLQTHDVIEAISLSDADAVEKSVDEFSDSEKTSSSSSFAGIEPENLSQQGTRGLEESSSFSSNSSSLEESSSFSSSVEEFAEQIRKAIANCDRSLAIQVWDGLKAKAKRKLREEVKSLLVPLENENFKLLVAAGFLLDMQVKYVGDPQYAQQYEGVLEVYGMDEYGQITCRKPDGYLTTRMKPEELQKL